MGEVRNAQFIKSSDAYKATKNRFEELKTDISALENKDSQIARLADQNDFDIEKITEAIEACQKGDDRNRLENKIRELDTEKLSKNSDLEILVTELGKRV